MNKQTYMNKHGIEIVHAKFDENGNMEGIMYRNPAGEYACSGIYSQEEVDEIKKKSSGIPARELTKEYWDKIKQLYEFDYVPIFYRVPPNESKLSHGGGES